MLSLLVVESLRPIILSWCFLGVPASYKVVETKRLHATIGCGRICSSQLGLICSRTSVLLRIGKYPLGWLLEAIQSYLFHLPLSWFQNAKV